MALQNHGTQEIARYISTELDPDATLTRSDNAETMWDALNQLCLNEWDRPEGVEITEAELAEYIRSL